MKIVVFLGPSLPLATARALVDATYLPPAGMGDVARALAGEPDVIAIIDGVFDRVPAVWHKEILLALARGVRVLGAASMGALRAAELAPFGMIGVGQVFEAFHAGVLEDDDEVAVAHAAAEHGHRPLSDAMVSIREGLRRAQAAGVLSAASARRLELRAKARFYPERSWNGVLADEEGAPAAEREALRRSLPTPPDVKAADAIALLERLRAGLAAPALPPPFVLESTTYLRAVLAAEAPAHAGSAGDPITHAALGRHVRLVRPDRRELLRAALHAQLAAEEARRAGLLPAGLAPPLLPAADLRRRLDELEDQLIERAGAALDPFLAVELARRGELDATADEVRGKWARVRAAGVDRPDLSAAGVDLATLGDWYEARFGVMEEDAEAHARKLGFASWFELMHELVGHYVAATR